MNPTTVYALRHAATGAYMPATIGRSTRGWSWWEPDEGWPTRKPRLFFTLRSAQNARSGWAQGPFRQECGGGGDFYTDDHWAEVVPVEPKTPRKFDDLEIVEFKLIELGALTK